MSYFSKNLKYLRENKGVSINELSKKINVNSSTLSRWENEKNGATIDNAIDVANYFDVSMADLVGKDLMFDNAQIIESPSDIISIPVYGSIKAGIPLENQTDIVEYMEIPKNWAKGNKKLFGLKVSGDSMYPKYNDGEKIIFEQTNDIETYKNKDCAVMINHTESTFKKVIINDSGMILQPYNSNYDIMPYSNSDIENLPIVILGVARKRVSDIE